MRLISFTLALLTLFCINGYLHSISALEEDRQNVFDTIDGSNKNQDEVQDLGYRQARQNSIKFGPRHENYWTRFALSSHGRFSPDRYGGTRNALSYRSSKPRYHGGHGNRRFDSRSVQSRPSHDRQKPAEADIFTQFFSPFG